MAAKDIASPSQRSVKKKNHHPGPYWRIVIDLQNLSTNIDLLFGNTKVANDSFQVPLHTLWFGPTIELLYNFIII